MIFRSDTEKKLNFHFSKEITRKILRDKEIYSKLVECASAEGCLLTLKVVPLSTIVQLPSINEMISWFGSEIRSHDGLYGGLEGHLYLSGFFSKELFCPDFANKSINAAVSINRHLTKNYRNDIEFKMAIAHGTLALSNPLESRKTIVIGGLPALKVHYMLDEHESEINPISIFVDSETRMLLGESKHSFTELSVINKPMGSVTISRLEK